MKNNILKTSIQSSLNNVFQAINSENQEFGPAFYNDSIVFSANAIRHDGMIIKNYICF